MYKKLLFLGSLVLVFGFSSVSYAKVIDLYINTKGAAVIHQSTDVKADILNNAEKKEIEKFLEDYDEIAAAVSLGINFRIVSGLYLGIQYSYELQSGDKEKDIYDEDADKEAFNTEVQQIIPTIGWNLPTFAKFMNVFLETGISIWDKTSVDKSKYQGDGKYLDVDVDLSGYISVGLNFQIVHWFSMYIKDSISYNKQTYKYDEDGDKFKVETKRTYFTFEFGPKFSF